MGKLIGNAAMTAAQRKQRRRDKLRAMSAAPPPDLLTLDADAIAARIMMGVPPEKADRIVAALNQRLVHWRVGTFDPLRPHVTGGSVHR